MAEVASSLGNHIQVSFAMTTSPDESKSSKSDTSNEQPLPPLSIEKTIASDDTSLEELYKLDYETEPIAAGGEILKAGHHVYMWCTLYQHHGIVLDTGAYYSDEGGEQHILIAEFTNVALANNGNDFLQSTSTASGAVSEGVDGGFRFVEEFNPSQWHLVKYHANPLETMTWRPGTCSAARPSPMHTILARVQFLHDCRHLIPDYHILACNCETVAVWCVTGKWETLQGSGIFNVSKIGALAAAGVVAVPVGLAAGGLAAWHEFQVNQKWGETAEHLNREFEWYAMGKRPTFNPLKKEEKKSASSEVTDS